ncbi:hypothetical protein SAMN05216170_1144 [Thermococcus thioreducens]|uniref:Uncharacterized protein n=1 Tax=Thermococcus thioreducens TaxID=277988 RepID=A0A1I0N703_9EURY|nr:hypothetical protein SAMN05216170_1144 [Thermococcus thioreducens]
MIITKLTSLVTKYASIEDNTCRQRMYITLLNGVKSLVNTLSSYLSEVNTYTKKTINPKSKFINPTIRKRATVVTADSTGFTEFSRFLGRPVILPMKRPKIKTEFRKRYSRKRSAS